MSKLRGFTLVELMIATTIFSVVLLAALTGFFQIGKIYFKGVVTSQTQASAQKILDDMTSSMQFANNITKPTDSPGVSNRGYMCIGGTRYTYILYNQVNGSENRVDNFGVLRDTVTSCSDPFTGLASGVPGSFNNPTEMLGAKMRLSKICVKYADGSDIDTSGSNCTSTACTSNCIPLKDLWLINLKVSFGDNDILNGYASANPSCNGGASNSQYCTVANLQAVVNRGYGN